MESSVDSSSSTITEAQYLDPARFPLSTQVPPISLHNQMLVDAVNQNDLTEMQEMGRSLNEEHRQIFLELLVKADLRKQRAAQRDQQAAAQLQAPQPQPNPAKPRQ